MKDYQNYYVIFATAAGWVGISGSDAGISGATLPQPSEELAGIKLGSGAVKALYSESYFKHIVTDYLAYFRGHKVDFTEELDLRNHTPFERAVWKATQNIPYGNTRAYAQIARQIGKPAASRAVGQALGRNPLAIIVPCHRVIASNGKLGGFGGGLPMKQYLLNLEANNTPGGEIKIDSISGGESHTALSSPVRQS
jgi:methylated-DNA-[protein]-cysteine S-methyltransferase